MKKFSTFCITILIVALSCKEAPRHPGDITYQTYCAGCHGTKMQGGLAAPLIKTEWLYGRERNSMVSNTRFGIPGTEMIAWGVILSNEQINDVIDYIVESQDLPPQADRPIPERIETEDYTLKVEKLAQGISKPWGIEFVDTNTALISEGTGGLRWLINNELDPEPIRGLPKTYSPSRSVGMMDLAIDPDYVNNGWVYLSFSFTEDSLKTAESAGMTKIVRARIKDHEWVDQQTLFEAPDSLRIRNGTRWGCRLFFDRDGYFYFTIGDMDQGELSQDLSKPVGKVFRINADGTIPEDNPFVDRPGTLPGIYSLGNRNVQGITQDPTTGTIWMTEHGPMGGDELNILKKGTNYGWPVVTYGIDYSGKAVSEKTEMGGMEPPITYWTPSIAVCPIEFCSSPLFPKWSNNLFLGALAHEEIRRLVVENETVTSQEVFLKGLGRVRDIKISPDGTIYVLLNEPDVVLRLTPE